MRRRRPRSEGRGFKPRSARVSRRPPAEVGRETRNRPSLRASGRILPCWSLGFGFLASKLGDTRVYCFEATRFAVICDGSLGKLIEHCPTSRRAQSATRCYMCSYSGDPGTWVRTGLATKPGHRAAHGALSFPEPSSAKHTASCSPPRSARGAQPSSWNVLMSSYVSVTDVSVISKFHPW